MDSSIPLHVCILFHTLQFPLCNKQIAQEVGKNEKTVDRQIGMTPKFVLVGRMRWPKGFGNPRILLQYRHSCLIFCIIKRGFHAEAPLYLRYGCRARPSRPLKSYRSRSGRYPCPLSAALWCLPRRGRLSIKGRRQ